MYNRTSTKFLATEKEIQARYSIYFVKLMRKILKDADKKNGERIKHIEPLFHELETNQKFLEMVSNEFGEVDSYTKILGVMLLDPPGRRHKRLNDLFSIITREFNFSSIFAFFSIKAWQARNYFLMLLFAYEAREAKSIEEGVSEEESTRRMRSEWAKKAALARHEKTTHKVMAKAIELYEAKSYPSPHRAAIAIVDHVKAYAEEIGKPLSPDRAQQTIYEWLRKYKKHNKE